MIQGFKVKLILYKKAFHPFALHELTSLLMVQQVFQHLLSKQSKIINKENLFSGVYIPLVILQWFELFLEGSYVRIIDLVR